MTKFETLESRSFQPNWEGLVDNIRRKGTPDRAYLIELFQDLEIEEAIIKRFGLEEGLDANDPAFAQKRHIALRRFSGFDFVRSGLSGLDWKFSRLTAKDTEEQLGKSERAFADEHSGPIMSWDDFEKYPWPDPNLPEATAGLEWYSENLPDDMCIIGSGGVGHFAEHLTWLMGFETLCFALFDDRKLVAAIAEKLLEIETRAMERILQFDRVKLVWSSDDMGYKTGLMISPDDTREFMLPGHKKLAAMAHAAGNPYLLHSCGKLEDIIDDLIDDVQIDAKHSFEDTIEDICEVKKTYGQRTALLGGIDVDFLCRSDEAAIRQRVRKTLDACQPGGGYCLGTGNSVANYVPLDNYLTMVDEGMKYGA